MCLRKQRYFGSTALVTPESPKVWRERSKIAIPKTEEELQDLDDFMNCIRGNLRLRDDGEENDRRAERRGKTSMKIMR